MLPYSFLKLLAYQNALLIFSQALQIWMVYLCFATIHFCATLVVGVYMALELLSNLLSFLVSGSGLKFLLCLWDVLILYILYEAFKSFYLKYKRDKGEGEGAVNPGSAQQPLMGAAQQIQRANWSALMPRMN